MEQSNEISCEIQRRRWNWLGHREGDNDSLTALGWTTEGRRARGRPLEEGLWRGSETRQGGRVGMQPRRWHGTEIVGHRTCRPYTPTGAHRLDGDDEASQNLNDFSSHLKPFEVYVSQLKMSECHGLGEANAGLVFLCRLAFTIRHHCNLTMHVVLCAHALVEN